MKPNVSPDSARSLSRAHAFFAVICFRSVMLDNSYDCHFPRLSLEYALSWMHFNVR
jgi:hypothetical protein